MKAASRVLYHQADAIRLMLDAIDAAGLPVGKGFRRLYADALHEYLIASPEDQATAKTRLLQVLDIT